MNTSFLSASEEETRAIAARFARGWEPGTVVCLLGEMGAGKTHFVQGVAAALGGDSRAVTSPTFTLIQHYDTAPPLIHMDLYRLSSPDQFLSMGGPEYLDDEAICLIEWPQRFPDLLDMASMFISMRDVGRSKREITLLSQAEARRFF